MADNIQISIELADKAAQKALSDFLDKSDKSQKSIKKLGDSGAEAFNQITIGIGKSIGAYEIFQGNLAANLVVKSFETLQNAASRAFDVFIVEGVKASEDAEQAFQNLSIALAQNGNFTDNAGEAFERFAKQMQATTKFEDDAIIKNAALLESMTGLKEEGLERASEAAINLASAFNLDLETAFSAIGKASEGNVTSLKKLGVSFVEAGTKAGTFENVLSALETGLGDNAAQSVKTFAGTISQAKNAFQDLQESIGNLIIKNPVVVNALQAVVSIFQATTSAIEDNSSSYSLLVGEAFAELIQGALGVSEAFNVLAQIAKVTFGTVTEIVEGTVAAIAAPLSFFSKEFEQVLEEASTNIAKASDAVEEGLSGTGGPLDKAIIQLRKIGDAADFGLGELKQGAEVAGPAVENLTGQVAKLTEEQIRAQKQINEFVTDLAKQNDAEKDVYDKRLADLNAFHEAQSLNDTQFQEADFQLKLDRENNYYDQRQELLQERLDEENALIASSTVDADTKYKAELEAQAKYNQDSERLALDKAKKEKEIEKDKVKSQLDVLHDLSQLTHSKNRELFEIGKAAAIAETSINTYKGALDAYAALAPIPYVGPALGIAAAAALSLYGAEQIANISSTSLQYAQGGIVPGTSFTGDKVPVQVNSGEMILNSVQQRSLFEIANGRGGSNNDEVWREIASLREDFNRSFNQPTIIQVNGHEIFNVTRDQLASGRAY